MSFLFFGDKEKRKRCIDYITEFRYIIGMNFRDLLESKNVNGYIVSKDTGIPYMTIYDLINGKTSVQNVTLRNAVKIAKFLNIKVDDLANLDGEQLIDFTYFRSNLLHDLKRTKEQDFINKIIQSKEIDYYYKNNGKEYAYYLLALIDYLCRKNGINIYTKRYNKIRKEKLEKPYYVGGNNLLSFKNLDEAEEKLKIKVLPEFRNFNIIEGDVYNVA